MVYHIESRHLGRQKMAVVHGSMPASRLAGWFPGVYEEILHYLAAAGIEAAGPPVARYTFHDSLVDVEAGFPVSSSVTGNGRVAASSLPAGPAAITNHYGPYEGLALAYNAVVDWLKERDLQPAGSDWEVYHTDPTEQSDPVGWRTELVVPYRSR